MVNLYHSPSSSTASFHSFDDNEPLPPASETPNTSSLTKPNGFPHDRFPPEEEASLLAASNTLKTSANALFGTASYQNAIQTYDRALASCPNYLDYEIAVLRSNVAACHVKLQEWKEAIESAGKGVECLERLEPLPVVKTTTKDGEERGGTEVEEIDDAAASRIEALNTSGHTLDQVRKLQIKLLLRRAKARSELSTWSSLQGADEDYNILLSTSMMPFLSPTDRRQIDDAIRKLAPKLKEAREREMGEMMDKLKGLGNSILKPFGLSTNNFQFIKDEKTGGYSMNFDQGAKKA